MKTLEDLYMDEINKIHQMAGLFDCVEKKQAKGKEDTTDKPKEAK